MQSINGTAMSPSKKLLAVAVLVNVVLICFLYSFSTTHLSIVAKQAQNQLHTVKECLTIDWSNPRYCTPIENRSLAFGSPFNLSSAYLMNLGIPLRDFVPIRRENLHDFVFATAANEFYFHIAMDAIGNIQKLLPNHTIYFYDLEVTRQKQHVDKIKSLCNVIYRVFNYSRYPSHVQYLKNYAFKPLVVHEMLSEFPRVFWIDSSIRFNTNNLSLTLDEVFRSGGILTFDNAGHSNFAVTHKKTYEFLPISASAAANTRQFAANSIYIHLTEEIYTRIIVWWVLCALREECMSPIHALKCYFKGKAIWAKCHRFDQSAINILMAHHFQYKVSRYSSHFSPLSVLRRSAHREHLIYCPSGIKIKSAKYFS